MEIHASGIVRHPIDRVYRAFRDEIPGIAAHMPNVSKVEERLRENQPDGVRLHNVWHGKGEIPAFAQVVVKPDLLVWDDFADWHDDARCCDWRIGLRVFNEQFKCGGTTRMAAEGPHTRIVIQGDLQINLRELPGVPQFIAGALAPRIEAFIVKLIRPNLEETNAAVGRYLDANP